MTDRRTVVAGPQGWLAAPNPADAVATAWASPPGAVATAPTLDEARHRAEALARTAPRHLVLLDDETARLGFRDLPKGTALHDVGTVETLLLGPAERIFALTRSTDPPPAAVRPVDRAWTNLPTARHRFVGRHQELEAVDVLLAGHRLVTLAGLGGAGKSRLAQVAAARQLHRFHHGVWWVGLGPGQETDVLAAVMAVLAPAPAEAEAALVERLRTLTVLLVLDQIEVAPVAGLVRRLVDAVPGLSVLCTGRAPLGLPDEAVVPVAGLQPDEAVELFVTRATGFSAPSSVRRLCEQLEGLPLALELAAVRTDVASPADLLAVLDGDRDPVTAAVTQAIGGLGSDERLLLERLAVIHGGTPLAGAAALVDEDVAVTLDRLERLIRQGLVVAEHAGEVMRYDLRDAVRSVVRTLAAAGTEAEARRRHLAWIGELAAEAYEPLLTDEQPLWLDRLEAERTATRSTLVWGFAHAPAVAVTVAVDLWRFWYLRGAVGEGRRWLEQAIAVEGVTSGSERARLLNAAANLAVLHNDVDAARGWLEESVALRRSLDDPSLADSLNDLGILRGRAHDGPGAIAAFREAIAVARTVDSAFGVANATVNLAAALTVSGDPAGGLEAARAGLAAWTEVGLPLGVAAAHSAIAVALLAVGEHEQARTHLLACLDGVVTSGGSGHVPGVLEGLASAANGVGDHEQAARLLGAAAALRDALDMPVPGDERAEVERQAAVALAALGPDADAAARQSGAADPDALVAQLTGATARCAREGDVWVLQYEGATVRVRDSKGLRQLVELLARPAEAVTALALSGSEDATAAGQERARKAVRKALRGAVDHIAGFDGNLGRHLADAIHTGAVCSYSPQPPVRWDVQR